MKNKIFVVGTVTGLACIFLVIYLLNRPPTPVPQVTKPMFTMTPTYRIHNQTYGNPSAKVTVIEFFDPECEACRLVYPIMKRMIKEYASEVKFVYRYMPLHHGSMYASVALEEARELNKYDQALDILFERQPVWGDHREPRPDLIPVYLQEIGIPKSKLDKDYLMGKHSAKVIEDRDDGKALDVRFTPTIFVDGQALSDIDESTIRSAIETALRASQK